MLTENIIQAGIKLFNISELDKTNKLLIECDLCPFLPVKCLFCRQVIVICIDSKWYYNNKTTSLIFISG